MFMRINLFAIVIIFLFFGCTNRKVKYVAIQGNISNLPDGELFLVKTAGDKVDSTETRNGKFKMVIRVPEKYEPFLVNLVHLDKDNNKRLLSFPSNRKKGGHKEYLGDFYYGEKIDIEGKLQAFNPKSLKLPDNIKLVTLEGTVHWGKQTEIMYNLNPEIPSFVTDSNFERIQNIILKYPDSYYLLSLIKSNISKFNNSQLQTISSEFSPRLRASIGMKYIIAAVNDRVPSSIDFDITMLGTNNRSIHVIDTTPK